MSGFPFALDHPIRAVLLLALCCAAAFAVARSSRAGLGSVRGRLALATRCALLALLVLALCGLQWRRELPELTTVFVVDSSDSTRGRPQEDAAKFVLDAAHGMHAGDRVAVVQFGRDALVEESAREDLPAIALASRPAPDGSDLAGALRLARGLLPADGRRRVVVLTDGEVDGEDPAGALRALRDEGVDATLVEVGRERGPEVLVDEVAAPERVHEGEPFEVRVVLRASEEATGTLTITRDGALLGQQTVDVPAGTPSVHRFVERMDTAGSHVYRAHFAAEPDGFAQNDAAEALVRVEGQPSVLLVDPHPERTRAFVALLEAAGIHVQVGGLEAVPQSLAQAATHEAVIFSDLDSLDMTTRQMEIVRAHVRELGGGFLMVGGPDSFGPGGWYQTPVEDVLPVDMDVRNEKYYPSLTLITCIDKSGSMAGAEDVSKMDLAKEAAIQAIELLHGSDRAGVVAFDSAAKWVVPVTEVADKAGMARLVGTVRAGGGTDLYPALEMAGEALLAQDTALRQIILLSDGQSPPRDYEGLLRKLVAEHVTVSAVAVGSDSDLATMQSIAQWGGGRYYFTDDPANVPRIFTKEALTAARSFVVEERFVPQRLHGHVVLRGTEGAALPALDGYVATTAKPSAEVALVTHREDPLLAMRRVGLGRSAAFTSDVGQRWAAEWMSSAPGRVILAQLLRWLSSRSDSSRLAASLERRGGRVVVSVEGRDDADGFMNFADLHARVVAPDLRSDEVTLRQVAPGRYEGSVPAGGDGAYFVGVEQRSGERVVRGSTAARVFSYSQEYRAPTGGGESVARLAAASGARILTEPAAAFEREGRPAVALRPAWRELLSLAAVLLLFDVALRRVLLPEGWAAAVSAWLARRWPRRMRRAAVAPAVLARLREVKTEALADVAPAHVGTMATTATTATTGAAATGDLPSERTVPSAPQRTVAAIPREAPTARVASAAREAPADSSSPERADFGGRLLAAKRRARKEPT